MTNRLLLLAFLLNASFANIHAQFCANAGFDTTLCGLSYDLIGNPGGGRWTFICDSIKKPIVLDSFYPGGSRVKVASCGIYKFVYHIDFAPCFSTDTVVINFENTSYRIEDINYKITLGYPIVNCQTSPTDSCGSVRTLPGIIPPLPNWKIRMDGKCEVFTAMPTIYGFVDSTCLADSIIHTIASKMSTDTVIWTTTQQSFITLDVNKKVTSNRLNLFINFINNSIINELDLKCPLGKCFDVNNDHCNDTFDIDTLNVVTPIHLGGNWFLKNNTSLIKLNKTNNITIKGKNYILKVPMGGDYYGPENISFELYSVNNQFIQIPLKDKIELEIIWKESWKNDTIPFYLIREINQDHCFCNGTTWNFGNITMPSIPNFNCNLTTLIFTPDVKPLILGNDFICKGSFVTLQSDNTYASYQWSNGDNLKSTTFYSSGKVILKVTDSTGCIGFDSLILREVLPPVLTINADKNILCRGECINLTGISDSVNTIIWNVIDTVRNINVCPSDDAMYFVKAISPEGCISEGHINLKVFNSPRPILGNDVTINCTQREVLLKIIDPDLGIARKSRWFGPGITNANIDSLEIKVSVGGKYWFEVKDSISTCSGADTIIVTVDTIRPKASAGPNKELNCRDLKITLEGDSSNTGTGYNILWIGPSINMANKNDVNPVIDLPGSYIINISNFNNECESSDTVIVTSNFTKPKADAGIDRFIFCDSLGVTLDGTKSVIGVDDNFVWKGEGIDAGNINYLRPFVTKPGTYFIVITNSKSHCVDSSSIKVTAPDTVADIVLTKSADLGCMSDSITLSASNSIGKTLRYTWAGSKGIVGTNSDTLVVYEPGKYYLFIYDSTTHCSDFDSIIITDTGGRPFVNAGPDRIITCELASVILSGSVNISNNNATIVWSGSGISGGNSGVLQPIVTKPGQYLLRITDKRNNCTGFDTVNVSQNLIKPTTDLGQDLTLNCITDTFNVIAKINDTKPSYDFKWSGPGVTNATQRNNPLQIWIPGTYTTIINTPNVECLSYDTLIVNIDTLRTPLDLPDTLWFDCNNSSINYQVNDFSKIDSIEWFDIFNKKIITNNAGRSVTYSQEGINFYIVLYKNGCKLTKSFLTKKYTKITI
ncbi:MAG: hypothetical protein ABIO44_04215, partial [Saprospiraceae bacterium]